MAAPQRHSMRRAAAGPVAVTTVLAVVPLHRTSDWNSRLIPVVIATDIAAVTAVLFAGRRSDPVAIVAALLAVVVSLIGRDSRMPVGVAAERRIRLVRRYRGGAGKARSAGLGEGGDHVGQVAAGRCFGAWWVAGADPVDHRQVLP